MIMDDGRDLGMVLCLRLGDPVGVSKSDSEAESSLLVLVFKENDLNLLSTLSSLFVSNSTDSDL